MILVYMIIVLLILCFVYLSYPKKIDLYNKLEKEILEIIEKHKDNNVIEKFPFPVYYINLERHEERRNNTENNLKKIKAEFTRIEAIDGKKIINKKNDSTQGIDFVNDYPELKLEEIGCILSHIKAIHTSYTKGDEISLICEDDINVNFFNEENFKQIIQNAPPDWEILQLFSGHHEISNFILDEINYFDWEIKSWSCLAYLINKKGMEKILSILDYPYHIKKINNNVPITGVADIWIYSILKTYFVFPFVFIPDIKLKTTIQNDFNVKNIQIPAIYNYIKKYDK